MAAMPGRGVCAMLLGKGAEPSRAPFRPVSRGSVAVRHVNDSVREAAKGTTMRQVRIKIKIKSRLRQDTAAAPPTVSRTIARTWFPDLG